MLNDWLNNLKRWREEKNLFFATHHDSPVPYHLRSNFKELNYFDPDPRYRIETKLHRYDNPEVVIMVTSKGTDRSITESDSLSLN
jgi:uncharacterized protein (DUF1684 family)